MTYSYKVPTLDEDRPEWWHKLSRLYDRQWMDVNGFADFAGRLGFKVRIEQEAAGDYTIFGNTYYEFPDEFAFWKFLMTLATEN